ncbi:MAG TPA: hypothetical protein VK034_29090 [Enhygromyxa sp.]|nr:hypothetical protein [Enhygromyxa sp.]
MPASHLDPLLRDAERRAVARVLRSHPEWTLGDVVAYIDKGGARSAALRSLPLRELLGSADETECADDGPGIDASVLRRARWATGVEFDELVRDVLATAGRPVGAGYLRARVGGPRWKLQAAVQRLVKAGLADRSGVTSATRYLIAGEREQQR